jgi:3',5'-cyclic AMP phosphodiesterase CpdA
MKNGTEIQLVGRRAFLEAGSLLLAAPSAASQLMASTVPASGLAIGLVTDLHYADKPPAGSRHYRETPEKLLEAKETLEREPVDFVVELGDFIDAADNVAEEIQYLKRIDQDFRSLHSQRHYVLGNHCVHTLSKQEFLQTVEQKESYYSFDSGGFHFIVLDSCYRHDGVPYGRQNFEWTDPNIPDAELEWLEADLQESDTKVVVFAHQRLDVGNPYGVKNAERVRRLLEASGRVLAVFQGHSHKNDYHEINRIHYCTLVAMVEGSGLENSGFGRLEIAPDGSIKIRGFRKQANYDWTRRVR